MPVYMPFRNWLKQPSRKRTLLAQRPVIEIGIQSWFIGINCWHRARTGCRMHLYSKMVTVQFRSSRSCPIDDSRAYLHVYGHIILFIYATIFCKVVYQQLKFCTLISNLQTCITLFMLKNQWKFKNKMW